MFLGDRRAAEEVVFDGGVRLERLGLNAGDGDDTDDIFSGAAAGEVVYGSGNALEDRFALPATGESGALEAPISGMMAASS